ncbi:hypothetical protein AB0L17_34800 [Streptomyces cellulosae]
MESHTLTVARRYVDAVSTKDFAAVAGLFADGIVCGENPWRSPRRRGVPDEQYAQAPAPGPRW